MGPTLERKITLDKATIEAANLTDKFTRADLDSIGAFVKEGYEKDEDSRSGWWKRNAAGMDLAMQITKRKSFPWQDASNVAFPLITIATLQFHSRAYPSIIQGTEVVRYRVVEEDPDGEIGKMAAKIGCHMSYQVLEEDQAWEEQHDRLLINIPIVGCAFVKTRYDGTEGINKSELVLAQSFAIDYYAKTVETARRKTQIIPKYKNDVVTGVRSGRYRDVLQEGWYTDGPLVEPEKEPNRDKTTPPASPDPSAPFVFLEQHTWMDLDKDGYEEPVIITVEKSTGCVVQIALRFDREEDILKNADDEIVAIRPTEYYTKYGFIPSPDGSIYDMGFGALIGPLNNAVNTNINQLIDAGTMKNLGGGFLGRGAKIRGGNYAFSPGEWKRVDSTGEDLKKSLVALETPEPSPVLFNLLTLLIQYTDRIAGSTEASMGENPGQNMKVGTYEGMIEQGSKVYAAIFKRVWRSMKEEFKKLYLLNAKFLSTTRVGEYRVGKEDYQGNANRICPVADPNVISEHTRVVQALAIAERAHTVPGYNIDEAEINFLRALRVEGYKKLYVGAANTPPGKPYQVTIAEMKMASEQDKLKQAKLEFLIEAQEQQRVNTAQIAMLESQAQKFAADAQSEVGWQQVEMTQALLKSAKDQQDHLNTRIELALKALEIGSKERIEMKKASQKNASEGK